MSDNCTRRGFLHSLAGGSLLLPGLLAPLLADDERQAWKVTMQNSSNKVLAKKNV